MTPTAPNIRPANLALEALKRNNFATVLDILSREDETTFSPQHYLMKGLAELALQDWPQAQATFTAATKRFPEQAAFWLNRGIAEENLELTDEAISSHEHCLALNPTQGEAYGNLSNLYRQKKCFTEAEDMAHLALTHGASTSDSLNSLGLALRQQGKFAEAETALRQAHQVAPNNPDILLNRANVAVDQLHFAEAWPLFAAARALQDTPRFRHDESLARMLSGDYEKGLNLFESRLDLPTALRLHPTCPRWRGEDLTHKKLLIIAEQGFGDTIQFSRYCNDIPNGDLIWAVPKPLVRFLSTSVRGTVLPESSPLPPCDYYIPLMSLPWALRKTMPQEPWHPLPLEGRVREGGSPQTPIYTTPHNPADSPARPKIGLVHQGSPTHERDHERSIPLKHFAPLFQSLQADFYALGLNTTQDEIAPYPITSLAPLITDFADTAALLQQLDLLITVDTATAHLAGTLGLKTYLLLPHCPDWRWGTEGDKTQWYPSLTLLRQDKYGDWEGVIEKLTSLLKSSL